MFAVLALAWINSAVRAWTRDVAHWLIALAGDDAAAVAVGIEVPHGAVVETLLERGLVVFALNPKQLDRFRDRFTGATVEATDGTISAAQLFERFPVALLTT